MSYTTDFHRIKNAGAIFTPSVFSLHLMHVFRIIHPYKVPPGPCQHFSCQLQTEAWTMTQFQDCISGLNPAVPHGSFLKDLIVDFEELTDQPSGHRSRWPTQLLRYFFNPHNWWQRRYVDILITVTAKSFVSKWLFWRFVLYIIIFIWSKHKISEGTQRKLRVDTRWLKLTCQLSFRNLKALVQIHHGDKHRLECPMLHNLLPGLLRSDLGRVVTGAEGCFGGWFWGGAAHAYCSALFQCCTLYILVWQKVYFHIFMRKGKIPLPPHNPFQP